MTECGHVRFPGSASDLSDAVPGVPDCPPWLPEGALNGIAKRLEGAVNGRRDCA
jgi:hypothetical protein